MDLSVLVFNSYKDATCGHALSLREIVNQECPICGKTVGFIQEESPITNSPHAGKPRFVYFKFGKISYRLNVVESRETSWWSSLFFGGNGDASDSKTAQARIQTVLGLSDEMKILCKGKVLYPKPDEDEETVSASLIDMSSSNWRAKAAPSLTVMGTPAAARQRWLEREKSYLQQRSSGNSTIWLILDASIHFARHVFVETMQLGISCAIGGYRLLARAVFGSPRQHVH